MKAAAHASATSTPARDNYLGMRSGFLVSSPSMPSPPASASRGRPRASTGVPSDTAAVVTGPVVAPSAAPAPRPGDTYMGLLPGFFTSPGSRSAPSPAPSATPPRVVNPRVMPSLTDRDAVRSWFGQGVVDRLVDLGERNTSTRDEADGRFGTAEALLGHR